MKKFKEPELEVAKFEVEDIMSGSSGGEPTPEEDESPIQPLSGDPLGKLIND